MTELDIPANRSYEWEKVSREVKEDANHTCQRCGKERGKSGLSYIAIETHHIVKGKLLPKPDARISPNLVAVCLKCHGRLENEPPETQFRMVGRDRYAAALAMLKEGRCTPEFIAETTSMGVLHAYSVVSDLCTLGLARRVHGRLFEIGQNAEEES